MLNKWHEAFLGCEPVAYLVTDVYPDRWVRFHSLPGSKRYPDTEAEYATVRYRHNTVLRELVGGGRQMVLLTTGYSDSTEPVRQSEFDQLDPDGAPWRTIERETTWSVSGTFMQACGIGGPACSTRLFV